MCNLVVLQRYFYREIFVLSILVSLSLVGILALYRGGEVLQELAGEGIDFLGFLVLVLTSVPELMELLLPVGFLVAILSILHRLRESKELLISLLSGVRPWEMMRPFLVMGVGVGLLTSLLSFYVAPMSREASDETLRDMLSDRWSSLVKPGRFVNFLKDMTVYAHGRDEDGVLEGVVLDDARDGFGHVVAADRAVLDQQGKNLLVLLRGVTVMRKEQRLRLEGLQVPLEVDTWSYTGSGDPTRLGMGEIYEKLEAGDAGLEDGVLLEIEWHRRLSRFPMVLALVSLACSLMFLLRQERMLSRRPVILASLGALGLELTNLLLQKSALDNPEMALSFLLLLYPLYMVPVLLCCAWVWLGSRFYAYGKEGV
jgi:lipopolysaccharide export LptBFGC system permease protein LptF